MVQTHAQPYKHIIHVYAYKYNERPVSQNSNIAAHTLPRRTATTTEIIYLKISCCRNVTNFCVNDFSCFFVLIVNS